MYHSHYLGRNTAQIMTGAHTGHGYTCPMDMMPQRIRSARKAKGWSQAELAKRAGTDQAHISRLENGEVGGSIDLITRIARELDVTASQLIGDDVPDYGSEHPATSILNDDSAPEGLRAFARDSELVKALNVSAEEWESLRSVKLPKEVSKDGYVQLLITIRSIS